MKKSKLKKKIAKLEANVNGLRASRDYYRTGCYNLLYAPGSLTTMEFKTNIHHDKLMSEALFGIESED